MIEVFVEGPIGTIRLNRPKQLNALVGAMREELLAGIRRHVDDDSVGVLVLTGQGRGFCAGGDLDLVALDISAGRLAQVDSNLQRLGQHATLLVGDAADPASWWDGRPFERILADVPCSGSGVARRHPDIKWLRRAQDLPAFARRQAAILDALWFALAPGGKLLYVTCSMFAEENGAVVDSFCARTPQARRVTLPGGAPAQLLPGPEHDGFFFALLEKAA